MNGLKTLFGCFIALLLTSNIGFSETYHSVKVTADKLNIRQDMSIESPILGHLDQETLVETSELKEGWYQFSYGGRPAYIAADYVEVTEHFIMGSITSQHVNLRDMPSIEDSHVLTTLSLVPIQVHEKQENWYKITTEDGVSGYVFADFVSTHHEDSVESGEASLQLNGDYPADLITLAKSKLGCPYVWAGEGPDSFDCSGFIKYVFKEAYNMDLPHSASGISIKGDRIAKDQLQAGDLVFFTTNRSGKVNHVGIYLGNNEFIHASSSSYNGHQVHINPLNKGFYSTVYKWGQRLSVE